MENFDNLCKRCMNDKGEAKKCPFCGYIEDKEKTLEGIKQKLVLQDKYIVGNKLSENSEYISYIGYDTKNKSRIHIREFFPVDICVRCDDYSVKAQKGCEGKYENLKRDFLDYFRALAKVRDIDAMVSVYDIFTQCGTAYIISEIIDGISLEKLIKKNESPLSWDIAKVLFMPVLSALAKLSRAGIKHLAISPETLIIGRDGKMHISGFATANLRQYGMFSQCELYDGFAAPEQYAKDGKLTEATDIYGFTASLFFALVGFAPKNSIERDKDYRILIPIKTLKNVPPHVVSALVNGLNIDYQQRTQSFENLRDELTETSAKYIKEHDNEKSDILEEKINKKSNVKWIACSSFVVVILLFGLFFGFLNFNHPQSNQTNDVSLRESNISENIIVPDLVGQDFDKLKEIASENNDYEVFLSEKVFDDNVEEGKIISQIPQSGGSVKKGSSIVVTVSNGSQFRELPPVENLSLSYVSSLLSKQGFIPSKVDEYSNEIEPGNVIKYKDHMPGDKLEYGSTVVIVLSKGQP